MTQRPRLYMLYSLHHEKWWSPNGSGYTDTLQQGGIFSEAYTSEITSASLNGWHAAGRRPTISIEIGELIRFWGLPNAHHLLIQNATHLQVPERHRG